MRSVSIWMILWMTAGWGCTPDPVETDLLIPVSFTAVPAGLALTQARTRHIEIRLRGVPSRIRQMESRNLIYPVDLFADLASDPAGGPISISPGFYAIPFISERLGLSPGVDILKTVPSFIQVQLDREIQRTLPVEAVLDGVPAEGFEVGEKTCDPGQVTLQGPASLLGGLEMIRTKPVSVDGLDVSLSKKGSLDMDDLPGIRIADVLVTVNLDIRQTVVTRTLKGVPVNAVNFSGPCRVTPHEMDVTLKGPLLIMDRIKNPSELKVSIDLDGLAPGVYVRPVVINVPVGLMLVDAGPENFTITIEQDGTDAAGD